MAKPSALLLLSGGPDSAVMAAWAAQQGTYDCTALHVRFTNSSDEELRCAQAAANSAKIPFNVIDMSKALATCVKEGFARYTDIITLSLAASFASARDIRNIFSAVIKEDEEKLQQNGTQLRENVQLLERLLGGSVKIHTPFLDKTKDEVLSLGQTLSVNFKDTISCFQPVGSKHCGVCEACHSRCAAFKKNGMKDPVEYNTLPTGKPVVAKVFDCCCI